MLTLSLTFLGSSPLSSTFFVSLSVKMNSQPASRRILVISSNSASVTDLDEPCPLEPSDQPCSWTWVKINGMTLDIALRTVTSCITYTTYVCDDFASCLMWSTGWDDFHEYQHDNLRAWQPQAPLDTLFLFDNVNFVSSMRLQHRLFIVLKVLATERPITQILDLVLLVLLLVRFGEWHTHSC